jgi:hypothetical protein
VQKHYRINIKNEAMIRGETLHLSIKKKKKNEAALTGRAAPVGETEADCI